jgi:Dyp-type peroxidase family
VDVASAVFYSAYPTSTVQDVRTHEDGASARHLRAPDHDTPARDIEAQQVTPLAREEWADIQGFILRNYHMPLVRHFILRIDGAREARRFIAAVVNSADGYPQITTAAAEWKKGNAPEYCLNIGFTYAGLKALKLPASSLESFVHSPAFVEGAFARAPRVGDVEESARDRWDDALRKPDDAHILLSLYAGEDKEWRSRTDALEALFQRHAIKSWQPAYEGKALSGGRIHFGYRDGISQPTIAGAPAPEFPDSQPPVSPGAFLLGYPSQWKDFRYPVPHPPELGRNGSFVAFRILEQDVAAFEQYLKETAAELKERYPEIDMNEEMLAAKICGRWRNGVPLVLSPDSPDTKIPREQWNNFTYAKDIEGYGCPFGSHMRRTHPRGDMVAGADGHQHRIIRRGMPYGPPYEEAPNEKRGLFGLFICVSLEDQFEFLMADWINQGGFRPGVPTGAKDPLFGSKREEKSQFIIPTEKWPLPLPGLHRFVTTRGGAYCFLPSITALKYIAAL